MQDVQNPAPEADKPNGPVAAPFVAAGIGSVVLGIFIVLNEVAPAIHDFLDWSKNWGIGSGVGPLSGKALLATIAFFGSWGILHYTWREREVDFDRLLAIGLVLVGIGFALTFPPIFEFIVELFPASE